jgi:putative oxidoreductase
MKNLFNTDNDPFLMMARLIIGIIFFAHGAQKALGWFGGLGFDTQMTMFTQMMHIPKQLALLAIAAEFGGGICLILGFLTRLAALGILANMAVAIVMVHLPNGLFMNWNGKQAGEGFEYHLLAIALCLVLLARGGGAASVDRAIAGSPEG